MPQYKCVAVDVSGKEREIIREAFSTEEAARKFSTGELFLLSIEPLPERVSVDFGSRISTSVIREYTDMTAHLLESGMDLRESLTIMVEIGGTKLKNLAGELLSEIDKGDPFSKILERRSASFSPLYRGMVRIGERVGSLEKVFPRLASYLANRKSFRDKIMGTLAYPFLVLAIALLGSAGIAFFLLPRLQSLFEELGGNGAADITRRVLFASTLFQGLAVVLTLVAALFVTLFAIRRRGGPQAISIDRFFLAIPVIGRFLKDWEALNFSFSMEILIKGGVPMETALMEAAQTSENSAFRSAILAAREDLLKGISLSTALGMRKEVPAYVSRWIGAGERSGQTDRVFAQVRSYFQAEMDRGTSRFTALLEPMLIVLVGGIVLFLVVSFVLPLFSLYGSML